jgi:hypothetical protein
MKSDLPPITHALRYAYQEGLSMSDRTRKLTEVEAMERLRALGVEIRATRGASADRFVVMQRGPGMFAAAVERGERLRLDLVRRVSVK